MFVNVAMGGFNVNFDAGTSCRVYRTTKYNRLLRIEEEIWYYLVLNGAGFLSIK